MSQFLCDVDDLSDGACREFAFPGEDGMQRGFVVRHRDRFYAYHNSCPHQTVTLNWAPDMFLDFTGRHIQCGLHGALFRIADGECVSGPCFGRRLRTLPARVENGGLYWCGGRADAAG